MSVAQCAQLVQFLMFSRQRRVQHSSTLEIGVTVDTLALVRLGLSTAALAGPSSLAVTVGTTTDQIASFAPLKRIARIFKIVSTARR